MLAVRIIFVRVRWFDPRLVAREVMFSPLSYLASISGSRARSASVRALCGVRGPGLMGVYAPCLSSNLRTTILSQPNDFAIDDRDSPESRRMITLSIWGSTNRLGPVVRDVYTPCFSSNFCTTLLLQSKSLAMALRVFPWDRSARIFSKWASRFISTVWPRHRPFLTLSSMLSCGVPKNRCLGLVHSGLSQVWQTSRPSGIGPWYSSHAKRWASVLLNSLVGLKVPYPFLFFAPNHGQQSSVKATLCQNLSSTVNTITRLCCINAVHYTASEGG